MTKFRYIGEYPEGKTELTVFGRVFSPGAEIEVPAQFECKARNNRFFEEVTQAVPPPDGRPSRDDLLAIAEAQGIKIDRRWGYDRLCEAIATHSKETPSQ